MRKKPTADLKTFYTIFLETGLIITLLLFITAARIDFTAGDHRFDPADEQEIVEMEDIPQTEQQKIPPPERPQIPLEVPDDEIIEEEMIEWDSDLDFDEPLEPPSPPPGEGDEEEEEDFFEAVEQPPVLIGGAQALHDLIKYPKEATRANISGTVHLQFIVNKRGEVENPVVLRGIGGGCDAEALRVIRLAKFRPGIQAGEPVRVLMGQQIHFRLRN